MTPVRWVASARKELQGFPQGVRRDIGQALYAAQHGETYPSVKALKGFGGASVLEIVAAHDTDTYRAVYTVQFAGVIYVLHAFQKKSKTGAKTPQRHVDLIRQRLQSARLDYERRTV